MVRAGNLFLSCVLTLVLAAALPGQAKPQNYKGLEISVAGIERTTNLSLADCPAGANSVRGVIRPGDANEFAAVKVDIKVTTDFKAGTMIAKPVAHDLDGKAYNTAQSFADIGAAQSFSCTFAFRVPKGAKLKSFAVDTLTIDVSKMTQ
jgi:hypothetical protein